MKIEIKGKEYPCYFVMGAFLRFKRETGKDVSQIQQDDLEDLLMLMWCCVKCSCQAEDIDFSFDFESFCNSITPAVLSSWNEKISELAQKKRVGKA